MSDEPDTNVLDYLRAQFDRVHLRLERIEANTADVKQRLTTLEIQVGALSSTEASHYGQAMQRFDRVETRLDRIERRLDLVDAPP